MRKDGDINWTERESSLKHYVHSNAKHKTKEMALSRLPAVKIRVKNIESVIVEGWKFISKNLLT